MKRATSDERQRLIDALGLEIVRFQDASNAVDDAAAAVLALDRADLQCVSMLLFGGPAPIASVGHALHAAPAALRAMVARLELAGYVRRERTPEGDVLALTAHAHEWIATIWGPIEREGTRLLARRTTRELRLFLQLLEAMRPTHEAHAARIRGLLDVPASRKPSRRARGGLSPAALRRVQLYVEANLAGEVQLPRLAARAGLSTFHFARAFRTTVGITPRKYVEERRIEKARQLLETSDLSLAQVALACGLGTQSRFTTTFRRATGLTPAVVRRGR